MSKSRSQKIHLKADLQNGSVMSRIKNERKRPSVSVSIDAIKQVGKENLNN